MRVHGLAVDNSEPQAISIGQSEWRGLLHLELEHVDGRTRMKRHWHEGPLRVQKPLYPEHPDTAEITLLHPPGGLVQGDHLEINLYLDSHVRALFTTPGATKFYGGGVRKASCDVRIRIAAHAIVEWFPQETILFDGALGSATLSVEIEPGGRFSGWDVICFGRTASGERFDHGGWHQRLLITVDGAPQWIEQSTLEGGDPRFSSPAGFDGHSVCATFFVAGHGGTRLPMERLKAKNADPPAIYGVSVLPEILVARYLGNSVESARNYFSALWAELRPLLTGRPFVPPRIWST